MRQYISFGPQAGISNRIKRLFSALRLEADVTEEIEMYWAISESVTEPFSELFSFDTLYKIKEYIVEDKITFSEFKDIGKDNVFRLLVPDISLPKGFTKAFPKDSFDKEYIDFEYGRIPVKVRELYLPFFSSLHPSAKVKARMEESNLPEKYVSVHIRLNDEWKNLSRGCDSDIYKFIRELKKYPKSTIFFLASCDCEVAEVIKKKFPTQIRELPEKDYEGSVDAVADIYLLAGGSELIGSYGSTFSELAWWLSGCKQEVKIIGQFHDRKRYNSGICLKIYQYFKAGFKKLIRN